MRSLLQRVPAFNKEWILMPLSFLFLAGMLLWVAWSFLGVLAGF